MQAATPQLIARDLFQSFRMGPRRIEVLRGISMEIAHGEALSDVVLRIQLASRVERVSSAPDHLGGQGYVGGDHQVAGLDLLDDRLVGDVEALRHADALDER